MSVRKVLLKSSTTRITTTSTSELKDELLKWICERHATNGPLDRKLLRDKAMELATSFGVIGFKCSEAWLTVFLKKYGFSPTLTNCNGPTFTDYRVWIDLLRSLITQYRHKDLFNVDELVMYSDFLPSRKRINSTSHQHGDDITQNHEISRISSQTKRIGILLCCNSSGTEKLEPLISNPYIMEKSRDEGPPYSRREISCISDENFGIWLEKFNTEMSNSHRNVLLLLSRERIRSLHNFQRLSNVKLVFLPKDFPAQLRPLRGDVFHCVKMTYRCRYVEFIRLRESSTREWSTKEIVESVFEAWKDVPQELIVSSFQRTKFRQDESFLKIQCPDWDSLETGMSFRKFVTFDDELSEISNRAIDQEIRYSSCANKNERRYNLRKSRRETVDLDDRDEITNEKSRKVQNNVEQRNVNVDETRQGQKFQDEKRSREDQETSKMKEIHESMRMNEIQEARDESVEFQNSQITELSDLTRANNSSESVVEPVVESLIIDADATLRLVEKPETVNTMTSKIYENPEKRRILMDRCLRRMKFPNEDLRPEVVGKFRDLPIFDEFQGNSLVKDVIDEGDETSSTLRREEIEHFTGVAGTSGKGIYDSTENLKDVDPPPSLEFDDEEKIRNDEELRLKILDAIEICGNYDERNNDENTSLTNNPSPVSSKRSRTLSSMDNDNLNDDDEPTTKRPRSDGNWSKCYETNFVFGPDINENPNEHVARLSTNDDHTNGPSPTSDRMKFCQTGSDETEKRCIRTHEVSGNLPSTSYPETKD